MFDQGRLEPRFGLRKPQRLAGIGDSGKIVGNCHRDLVADLGVPKMPKPFLGRVHQKVQKPSPGRSSLQQLDVSFLLPHEYFHCLYHHHRALFNYIIFGGGPRKVFEFCKGAEERKDPWLKFHPFVRTSRWQNLGYAFEFPWRCCTMYSCGGSRKQVARCVIVAVCSGYMWVFFVS